MNFYKIYHFDIRIKYKLQTFVKFRKFRYYFRYIIDYYILLLYYYLLII